MLFNLNTIIVWLFHYRYVVLFPLVVIEGPIVTIIAGFLSSIRQMNFFLAYTLVVIADVAADSLYYALGHWGRKKFIERWGRYIGLHLKHVERIERHFNLHTGKTLIIGKLSHVVGAPILVAAGLANVPFKNFLTFDFLATLPKSLVLLIVGFYFGKAYVKMNSIINYAGLAGSALFIIFILLYVIMIKAVKKYEDENEL